MHKWAQQNFPSLPSLVRPWQLPGSAMKIVLLAVYFSLPYARVFQVYDSWHSKVSCYPGSKIKKTIASTAWLGGWHRSAFLPASVLFNKHSVKASPGSFHLTIHDCRSLMVPCPCANVWGRHRNKHNKRALECTASGVQSGDCQRSWRAFAQNNSSNAVRSSLLCHLQFVGSAAGVRIRDVREALLWSLSPRA